MTRAGYVLQVFGLPPSNPTEFFDLLQTAGARALVCEPSFHIGLSGCPVPNYPAIQVREQGVTDVVLPPPRIDHSASDLVFIFHTSGSTTSGPKPIRCSRRWLDSVTTKTKQLTGVHSPRGQDVTVLMYGDLQNRLALFFDLTFLIPLNHRGSMCHIGQTISKRPILAIFFAERTD